MVDSSNNKYQIKIDSKNSFSRTKENTPSVRLLHAVNTDATNKRKEMLLKDEDNPKLTKLNKKEKEN